MAAQADFPTKRKGRRNPRRPLCSLPWFSLRRSHQRHREGLLAGVVVEALAALPALLLALARL
jgi:hypothetical protein